jgi:adenylate kinase family enzyme
VEFVLSPAGDYVHHRERSGASDYGLHQLAMKRVAVFGNAGAGKSTLARRLAEATGLPLYVIDIIQYPGGRYQSGRQNGGKLTSEEYAAMHADLLKRDRWIIDGFESVALAWERFAAADTLIYVDLPLRTHYWWITKRLINGLFRNPHGWPENTPVWDSTLDSYRVVWRCHRSLTPRYRRLVADAASSKRVHHLKTAAEIEAFLRTVEPVRQN